MHSELASEFLILLPIFLKPFDVFIFPISYLEVNLHATFQ